MHSKLASKNSIWVCWNFTVIPWGNEEEILKSELNICVTGD